MSRRLWLDVEDIFEYAAFNARPSGIQRVQFELFKALVSLDTSGDRVGFIRRDTGQRSFRTVAWADVEMLFGRLTAASVFRKPRRADDPPTKPSGRVSRVLHRLPATVRRPLVQYLLSQRAAIESLADLCRALLSRGDGRAVSLQEQASSVPLSQVAEGGDAILSTGAAWYSPDYAEFVARNCSALDLRFALLVYDLIPLRRPEWCDRGLVRQFRVWFGPTLRLADQLFAISRATASDVERYAAAEGLTLPGVPIVIPMGSGFAHSEGRQAHSGVFPLRGSYVLVVSTIEARKNHVLLFRVWRHLLEELPAEQVPDLVFAGRIGWMVDDLMQQLRNCNFLDGKLKLFEEPTDEDLAELYRGCSFTLFPSFYEGWGLPVTESLAFGRPCVASNATSLPEAGGDLVRYFDPDNATEAYNVIRATLTDREGLAGWQERVSREFRPVPWTDAARAILDALQ